MNLKNDRMKERRAKEIRENVSEFNKLKAKDDVKLNVYYEKFH